jgi:transcriptional regulator with XRE-family HTH domain
MLRKVAKEKKMNTAALARATKVPRGRMKHLLSGGEPMTVDELILLSQALELDPTGMAAEAEAMEAEPEASGPSLRTLHRREVPEFTLDPYGNHAWQIVQVGLMLSVDMFLVLDATKVQSSGIPKNVLARYPERLPLTLDAAYHQHHRCTYLPEGLQVRLSFDALYTCVLPWDSFLSVHLTPLPPDPVAPEPDPDPEPEQDSKPRRGHLRLV